MNFHISLAAARINANMTQAEAAKAIGVGTNTIINWEKEKTLPNTEKLKRISEVYNVPIVYLQKATIDIGSRRFKEINVTKDGELIASITGEDVIYMDGYKVMCVPDEN